MKKTTFIFFLAATLSLLSGCDVHEFPELPTKAHFTLHLDFDTEMPLYKEVVRAKARTVNDAETYDVRHIVSIHRLHPDGSYDRSADTLIVFTCNDVTDLNCSKELTLREGQYKFFVWTDFVDSGSQADKFYTTSDFSEIILHDKNNHIGNCDYRDAFRGSQQATVIARKDEMTEVTNEATVTMKRPLAKFKFVSTDYDTFVKNALRAEARKNDKGTADKSSNSDTKSRGINPDDYRVVFHYAGFMPCSYNMFTDKPADSWIGESFEGALNPTGSNEVDLGFDYVFVNGSEAGVSVRIEVYHKDGELVASSPSIDVPLKRSKLTIVKGNFLTSIAESGIGIIPDFDGEYNIEIK